MNKMNTFRVTALTDGGSIVDTLKFLHKGSVDGLIEIIDMIMAQRIAANDNREFDPKSTQNRPRFQPVSVLVVTNETEGETEVFTNEGGVWVTDQWQPVHQSRSAPLHQ